MIQAKSARSTTRHCNRILMLTGERTFSEGIKKMTKSILLVIAVLSMSFPERSGAEKPRTDFFDFLTNKAPSALFLSQVETRPDAVLVFQTLGMEDSFLQISGQEVSRIELKNGQTAVTKIRDIPVPLVHEGVATAGGSLYVAGGQSDSHLALFKLNLAKPDSGWTVCSTVPAGAESRPVLIGLHGTLYVTGCGDNGTASYAYNPVRNEWKPLAAPQQDMRGFIGISCGNDHLLFFNANNPDDRILAYHRITDTWFEMGHLPQAILPLGAASSGTEFALFSTDFVVTGKALLQPTKYGWVDHAVVALLVIALISVGMYFSKKEKSSGDYFRAGKRIPWWAAGLSLFASGASAISLMAMPGKAFADNWIYFSISLLIVIIYLPLILLIYIPLARRLNISTANDYLERRFSLPVRMLGFIIYSSNQMLGRMAAILLLPAIAISAIFGLPMEQSILIMGVVSTIYVTLGGLEAVIWTDVLQAVVMLVAVFLCCCWAFFSLDLTMPAAQEAIFGMNKLQMFDFSFDWTAPVFIILVTNVISISLGTIGDQTFIQRVQCTHNEKESRKAVIAQMAVAVPMNFVLFAMGTLLFLFYRAQPQSLSPALKADGIFPFFAAQNLPPGMAGFVVAALLAATMSTVAGAINSVANLGVEDVYRRFFPKATDHRCLILGRILTISLGVFGTAAALLLARTSLLSVWDLALMITGMILAPISGIFVLGVFTHRANSFGVWVGTVAAVLVNLYAKLYLNLNSMAFLTVGVFTCIVVGYLASFLAPKSRKELDGLTVFTLFKKKN
jgi:solute:Na+ symporter, SSS family